MDPDPALSALLTPEGRALVDRLTPYEEDTALHTVSTARADPLWAGRPEVVAAAATQARLRTRARERFPGPARWWTADGLEQATRPQVSRLHARRFLDAGVRSVADLGCGVGADALALAEQGIVVHAVDRDPQALWALAATARDRDLTLRVELGDVLAPGWWWNGPAADTSRGCFVDPARRREGRRLLDPEQWSPPWSWVCDLAARVPATGAKVAPGIDHGALPGAAQAEWVSDAGTLVECAVWWGPLRQGPAHRVATVAISPDQAARAGAPTETWARLDDAGGVPEPPVGPVGDWLVEPDPAVIRAGLVGVLAAGFGARLVDRRIAYLVADACPAPTPFGTVFAVVEEVPFGRKALRAHLRAAGYGDVVVKKRGVAVIPEQLRADLRLRGDGPTATLVLTRTAQGPLALLVRRAARAGVTQRGTRCTPLSG